LLALEEREWYGRDIRYHRWGAGDEGFGSQSDEILPMVIDAVKQVASRFGVVLVIGRVKAAQEAFDQKPEDESVEVLVA